MIFRCHQTKSVKLVPILYFKQYNSFTIYYDITTITNDIVWDAINNWVISSIYLIDINFNLVFVKNAIYSIYDATPR